MLLCNEYDLPRLNSGFLIEKLRWFNQLKFGY